MLNILSIYESEEHRAIRSEDCDSVYGFRKKLKEKVEKLEEEVEYYKKMFQEACELEEIMFYKCEFKDCISYHMGGRTKAKDYNCEYILECTTCSNDYCDLHIHEIGYEYVCNNCMYVRPTQINE